LEDKERKKNIAILRRMKRGEIPQGSTLLNMGELVLPLGGFVGRSCETFFWADFGEVWKCGFVGGMCEA
jgi:hypothetical protein